MLSYDTSEKLVKLIEKEGLVVVSFSTDLNKSKHAYKEAKKSLKSNKLGIVYFHASNSPVEDVYDVSKLLASKKKLVLLRECLYKKEVNYVDAEGLAKPSSEEVSKEVRSDSTVIEVVQVKKDKANRALNNVVPLKVSNVDNVQSEFKEDPNQQNEEVVDVATVEETPVAEDKLPAKAADEGNSASRASLSITAVLSLIAITSFLL